MVIKAKLLGKNEGATPFGGPSTKEFAAKREFVFRRDFAGKRNFGVPATKPSTRLQVDLLEAEETVDVIDLGAPRRLRRAAPAPPAARASPAARRVYTPNPRLYPGPAPRPRRRPRSSGRAGRSRRRVFRRPVPNARLYRPAPRRLPPPAEPPRGPWPPPQPPQPRALDTASRAALRLAAQRPPPLPPLLPHYAPALRRAPDRPHAHSRYSSGEGSALLGRGSVGSAGSVPAAAPPRARRLVVTLPAAAARAGAMDARRSPDDGSEADALSAPSEFLAERARAAPAAAARTRPPSSPRGRTPAAAPPTTRALLARVGRASGAR